MPNHIQKLYIRNFRNFNETDIKFNKHFNFLIGHNGCGKTSVIAAIAQAINTTTTSGEDTLSGLSAQSAIWLDIYKQNQEYRIGFGANTYNDKKNLNDYQYQIHKAPPAAENRTTIDLTETNNPLQTYCPLIIGANRHFNYKELQGMQKTKAKETRIKEKNNNAMQNLNGTDHNHELKQWLVNTYLIIDKPWAATQKANWEHFVNCLPSLAPQNSDFRFVEIKADMEPKFSIYNRECYLEELPAGFQAVLHILSKILDWHDLNQHTDHHTPIAQAAGTVVIDELDVHLHPEWQLNIRNGLAQLFPNLQFIVTTHSPHLLATAAENEIIDLSQTQHHTTIEPKNYAYYGWSTDNILSDIMQVKSLENKTHLQLIRQAHENIKDHNPKALQDTITKLKQVCHPHDAIVQALEIKLITMRHTNNKHVPPEQLQAAITALEEILDPDDDIIQELKIRMINTQGVPA